MLNLFRNKLVSNLAWVLFFALLVLLLQWLWQPPQPAVYYSSPLLQWLDDLHQLPGGLYISTGIVFIASLLIGFYFNYLLNRHEILFRQTFFPALFYFYFSHLFGGQFLLSPHFIASVLSVLLIYKYLTLDAKVSRTPFLDMGFFSGLMFCLSPDTVAFIPFFLFSLLSAGHLKIKNFFLFSTGIIIPVYFIGTVYFLIDRWSDFAVLFNGDYYTIDFERLIPDYYHIAILCVILFILLATLSGLRANYLKNTIRARKAQQMLLLFLISGTGIIIFTKAPLQQSFTLLAMPLSVFVSYYFLTTKKALFKETLFALFFIILIIAVTEQLLS